MYNKLPRKIAQDLKSNKVLDIPLDYKPKGNSKDRRKLIRLFIFNKLNKQRLGLDRAQLVKTLIMWFKEDSNKFIHLFNSLFKDDNS